MKICFLCSKIATSLYTASTIKHFCKLNGIEVVDRPEEDVDSFWVSICDPDDLPILKQAKAWANGKPVIMGGFEAFFGVPYLAWADYIVVGEGWDFISAYGRNPEEAFNLPCVLTTESTRVEPAYNVAYSKMPLVKLPGNKRYYYLGGRGCQNKCKFCATSWMNPYTHNVRVQEVASKLEKIPGALLTLISNDSGEVIESKIVNAQSVTVKDYVQNPLRYKSKMLHFGIEGWTEAARKSFSKPITDERVAKLFSATKEAKQQCELFFIVDYPGWTTDHVTEFINNTLPVDPAVYPRMHIKGTYFDPCPHTPFAGAALQGNYWSPKDTFYEMMSRNQRIRVFPTRSRGRSAWRTAFHRSTPYEAGLLGPEPKDTNCPESWDNFTKDLSQKGLLHLIGEQVKMPCSVIHACGDEHIRGYRTGANAPA